MTPITVDAMWTEGRICPLGIDSDSPRLSWSYGASDQRSLRQKAYRIVVASSQRRLADGCFDMWDSGVVTSRRHTDIPYNGAKLLPRQLLFWRVTVWDEEGNAAVSSIAWWEMGLRSQENWSGAWIGDPQAAEIGRPLPQFRRSFIVWGDVRQARAYICGLGHYELRLNGYKVGARELDPGWTDYDRTILYTVYDITHELQQGENAVGVLLGNGFYHVTGGRYTKFKNSFGTPKCLVNLIIDYSNGTSETICTDESWSVSGSPLRFSCIYGGEDYDARCEQPGWDRPYFQPDGNWAAAARVEAPTGILSAQTAQAITVKKRFEVSKVTEPKPEIFVLDLGQNFSGWPEISVSGPAGAVITLTPSELLTADGVADQRWTGSPYRWSYVLKGEGLEIWRPRFTYYGFRYVQVEGAVPQEDASSSEGIPVLHSLQGQMIYPEIPDTGGFRCSNQLLNRIHEIIGWAMRSNMKSVFTDCPHREKLGWLEQLHLMGPSLMFNYDVEALLCKVMEDMADAQQPNGLIPTTAPEYVVFEKPWEMFRDAAAWGGAYILAGWELLQRYGNDGVLRRHYEGMKRYADYLASRADGCILRHGLGDWYDIGPKGPGFAQNTPVALVETAIYYELSVVMEKIAGVLERPEDACMYGEQSRQIQAAFNEEFLNYGTGMYANGSDTAQAMALAIGLAPEEKHCQVLEWLIDGITGRGYQTTAGDVGHRYVLLALAQAGRSDLIFRMTQNTETPGYGYQIVSGATSLTEAWDGPTAGKSQNHFMLGHLEEWLYSYLAGLDYRYDPEQEHYVLTVQPNVVGGVDWAEAWCDLRSGRAAVQWTRGEDGCLTVQVHVPVNTEAVIYIPADDMEQITERGLPISGMQGPELMRYENGIAVFHTGSGTYVFTSKHEDDPSPINGTWPGHFK
ncbi:alpha-L-rhamnosidase [Paenibacillus sp. OAE614]|uniref:alpha-L-rhamnosidase n=1 Tax=Paenibacillus sp. OAE614 TaxID=2663804 RepID=UPI00178BFA69